MKSKRANLEKLRLFRSMLSTMPTKVEHEDDRLLSSRGTGSYLEEDIIIIITIVENRENLHVVLKIQNARGSCY